MAEHESIHSHDHRNLLSRRGALSGAAACGALVLPAGVAVAAPVVAGISTGTDPLIEMWAERQQAKAAADAGEDGPDEDELVDRLCRLEGRIARATPVSPEGAAIIATVLAGWFEEEARDRRLEGRDSATADLVGGATMARYILDHTPADVLVRAGLAT